MSAQRFLAYGVFDEDFGIDKGLHVGLGQFAEKKWILKKNVIEGS